MSLPTRPRLAVLIDGENVSHRIAPALFPRIADLGDPIVRQVHGDFASPKLQGWRGAMADHALTAHQCACPVPGKNAADIAMVIGAMDLLHDGFEAFCLVSSDSDFTGLALRLRAAGRAVCGVGRANAPAALRNAFRQFIPIESLLPAPAPSPTAAAPRPKPAQEATRLIDAAILAAPGPDGRIRLSDLGSRIRREKPDFRATAYGGASLKRLVERLGVYEVTGSGGAIWVGRKAAPVTRH